MIPADHFLRVSFGDESCDKIFNNRDEPIDAFYARVETVMKQGKRAWLKKLLRSSTACWVPMQHASLKLQPGPDNQMGHSVTHSVCVTACLLVSNVGSNLSLVWEFSEYCTGSGWVTQHNGFAHPCLKKLSSPCRGADVGLTVCGRHYMFLAYSSSQIKVRAACR
jgi:hypothetical protein